MHRALGKHSRYRLQARPRPGNCAKCASSRAESRAAQVLLRGIEISKVRPAYSLPIEIWPLTPTCFAASRGEFMPATLSCQHSKALAGAGLTRGEIHAYYAGMSVGVVSLR